MHHSHPTSNHLTAPSASSTPYTFIFSLHTHIKFLFAVDIYVWAMKYVFQRHIFITNFYWHKKVPFPPPHMTRDKGVRTCIGKLSCRFIQRTLSIFYYLTLSLDEMLHAKLCLFYFRTGRLEIVSSFHRPEKVARGVLAGVLFSSVSAHYFVFVPRYLYFHIFFSSAKESWSKSAGLLFSVKANKALNFVWKCLRNDLCSKTVTDIQGARYDFLDVSECRLVCLADPQDDWPFISVPLVIIDICTKHTCTDHTTSGFSWPPVLTPGHKPSVCRKPLLQFDFLCSKSSSLPHSLARQV